MKRLMLIFLVLTLAACGGTPATEMANLPTLADLPTATPTNTVSVTEPAQALPVATSAGTATSTITPSPTITDTITYTPSATLTDTITPTPSDTPTITPVPRQLTGLEALGELARQATILPPDFTLEGTPVFRAGEGGFVIPSQGNSLATPVPTVLGAGGTTVTGNCAIIAPGGFVDVDEVVRGLLGCPANVDVITANSAYQPFQNGFMIWVADLGTIFVIKSDGTYSSYPDTWTPNVDPESGNNTPPSSDLIEPIRGFGKVWREQPGVRDSLGWALAGEAGGESNRLPYERGTLLALPQRGEILALGLNGQWEGIPGRF